MSSISTQSSPARRDALRALTVAGTAAGLTAAVSTGYVGAPAAHAAHRRGPVTTFVFVGGANGPASADTELALLGHRTVGVPPPGQSGQFRRAYQAPQDLRALATEPSPMTGIRLDDYVEAAVRVVRQVARYGPVVLVGGSMGGATVTRVGNEVPELLHRMVYLSAFCCVRLPSAEEYLKLPEARESLLGELAAGVVADPRVVGGVRINWRTADPQFLANARRALVAEGSEGEFLELLNGLTPDESPQLSAADARGHRSTWGRVPRSYVRHTLDRCLPLALQDRMIREADALTPGNRFDVHSVSTGHYPTPGPWRRIVRILHSLASN